MFISIVDIYIYICSNHLNRQFVSIIAKFRYRSIICTLATLSPVSCHICSRFKQISFALQSSSKSIDRDTPTSWVKLKAALIRVQTRAKHRLTGSSFDRSQRARMATQIRPFRIIALIDVTTGNSIRFSHFEYVVT